MTNAEGENECGVCLPSPREPKRASGRGGGVRSKTRQKTSKASCQNRKSKLQQDSNVYIKGADNGTRRFRQTPGWTRLDLLPAGRRPTAMDHAYFLQFAKKQKLTRHPLTRTTRPVYFLREELENIARKRQARYQQAPPDEILKRLLGKQQKKTTSRLSIAPTKQGSEFASGRTLSRRLPRRVRSLYPAIPTPICLEGI
jgi:hypothetical protein